MLPVFIKYGKKYADFAWKNNLRGSSLIDKLPSYGPVRTSMAKRKVVTPLRKRARNGKRTRRSRSIFGDGGTVSSLGSKRSSREPSERSLSHESGGKIRCLDKDKEGANEYARGASKQRVNAKVPYKDLQQIVAPGWTEKYTCQSREYSVLQNTEKCLEHLFLDTQFVTRRVTKGNDIVSMGGGLNITGSTANAPVKFEGGRVRMFFINTCSNTLYFEIVHYKLKNNMHSYGVRPSTQAPLVCWNTDQGNTVEFGDLPLNNNNQPLNTARLANWTITPDGLLAAAETTTGNFLADDGKILEADLPAYKRPNPNSTHLRHAYNNVERTKITLKPGDTFRYDFRLHPFYVPKVKGDVFQAPDAHIAQDYSRFVEIFCRAEMAVGSVNGKVCPATGQFSMSTEYEMNWRSLPRFKRNLFIESSGNTATLGPYTDPFGLDVLQNMEQDQSSAAAETRV